MLAIKASNLSVLFIISELVSLYNNKKCEFDSYSINVIPNAYLIQYYKLKCIYQFDLETERKLTVWPFQASKHSQK